MHLFHHSGLTTRRHDHTVVTRAALTHLFRRIQIQLALGRRKRLLLCRVLLPSASAGEGGTIELGGTTCQMARGAGSTIPVFDETVEAGRVEHMTSADPFVCDLV